MSPQKNTTKPTMQPPESGVTVRMYNPGFGDCLLLAFRAEDDSARYMLIDCGVHHQYPNREERISLIAKDITEATANKLHVVVATHEHTDHLYGFKYGREIFAKTEIEELWLAWTEDLTDPVAKELKQLYGMRIRALKAAVNQLRLENEPLAGALQRVLDYEFPDALAAATGGKAAQLEYLRTKSKKKLQKPEDYRRPEEAPLTLPGVKGVKVYVLGPPKDVDWIKKLQKKSELYPELTAVNEIAAFAAAALAATGTDSLDDEDRQLFRLSRPFEESLEISKDDARRHSGALTNDQRLRILKGLSDGGKYTGELEKVIQGITSSTLSSHLKVLTGSGLVVQEAVRGPYLITMPGRIALNYGRFFRRYYGFLRRREHGPKWRRIDTDWLAAAEQLALDINGKTNNTSLVLAIELTDTRPRKVLLFAADAQVGNWLSWHQLYWLGEGQDGKTVTVADLLRRTVLYKVGHHGSRNATLSWKGLEMMESANLVAMIPVDQKWANNVMRWEHPAEKLVHRLKEKTRGRIIRTDGIPLGDEAPKKPDEATESEWQAFIKQLDWDRSPDKLWIQYTVLG